MVQSLIKPTDKTEWAVIAITAILLFIGLAIRFSTMDKASSSTLTNDIVIITIGICAMTAMYLLDFTFIVKHSKKIYCSITILMFGITFLSPQRYGGSIYVAYILILMPTIFASVIYDLRTKGYQGIILSTVYFIIPLLIISSYTNISSILLYIIVCNSLITYAITKGWF